MSSADFADGGRVSGSTDEVNIRSIKLGAASLVCIWALTGPAHADVAGPLEDAGTTPAEDVQPRDAGPETPARVEPTPTEPVAKDTATAPDHPTDAPVGEERTWTGTRVGITAGLAVVGVTGIIVGVLTSNAAIDADDRIQVANAKLGAAAACRGTPLPSACSDLSSARSDHRSALAGSYFGYGLGVVGLATAIATTFYWYTTPVRVVPAASPQSAGLFVMGSF